MQEYNIKGLIITEPMAAIDIEAGTVCLVNHEGVIYRVTVMHINRNDNWVVEGDYNGEVSDKQLLCTLSVLTKNRSFPIIFKDYKHILKKKMVGDNKYYKFTIKPHKFKEGKYVMQCSKCTGIFDGGRSQPYCESCCEELSMAHLIK
jgi:hypothetical protein